MWLKEEAPLWQILNSWRARNIQGQLFAKSRARVYPSSALHLCLYPHMTWSPCLVCAESFLMKCNVSVSQMLSLLLTLPGPDQRGHDPGNVITHQEVGGGRPKWRKPCRDECSLSAKPECYHWGQWEHGPWRHNKVGFWWLGHRETKPPSSWYGSIEEFRLMSPVGELGSRVWMHLSA